MARQFVMSMYTNKEDLYKAKAEYWETMAHEALAALYASIHNRSPNEDEINGLVDTAEEVLIKYNLI